MIVNYTVKELNKVISTRFTVSGSRLRGRGSEILEPETVNRGPGT